MITNRKALHKLSYGLYVVSSVRDGRFNGQIANALLQVSGEPISVAVSINKENLTHEYIKASGVFSASVLSQDAPFEMIGLFGFKSGRDVDKFLDYQYRTGITGAPVVMEHISAYFEAEVASSLDAGTHTIFLGKVVDADVLSDAEPMTYDYYHNVIKGKTPKKAASYIAE